MSEKTLMSIVNQFLNRYFGIRIERAHRTFELQRMNLIRRVDVDVVLDIGANEGQWALALRQLGYSGKLFSYEPIPWLASKMIAKSTSDNNWTVFQAAFSNYKGTSKLFLASNSEMSSSLNQPTVHKKIHPNINFSKFVEIDVDRVGDREELETFQSIYLKIDAQGEELRVLQGALDIWERISIIEFESSFTPLYKNESSHHEICFFLEKKGFTIWSTNAPHQEKSGQCFALDTLAIRSDLV